MKFFVDVVFNTGGSTVSLVSIAVNPATPSIAAGAIQQFAAVGTYSNGSTKDITSSVTWSSATPAAATINTVGVALGQAVGSSVITATQGTVSGNTLLTVTGRHAASSSATATSAATDRHGAYPVQQHSGSDGDQHYRRHVH